MGGNDLLGQDTTAGLLERHALKAKRSHRLAQTFQRLSHGEQALAIITPCMQWFHSRRNYILSEGP